MNQKINLSALIDAIAVRQGISKRNAEAFVREFFALIEEGLLKDSYLKIKGLGTFKLIGVEKRQSVNIQTGETIHIDEHSKISFTPEAALKELINQPFANFETVILDEDAPLEGVLENAPVPEEITADEEPITQEPIAPKEMEVIPTAKEVSTIKAALLQPKKTETDHGKWLYIIGGCLLIILLIFILIWIL